MKNKQHHLKGGFARVRPLFLTMAITKILARHARLDLGIKYILNGDKTEEHTLTAHLNCDPGRECREMLDTKRAYGKTDGVMYYHIIQSFKPGEITPELALEIAKEFAQEHLPGYETVIAVHVDRKHIHAHLIFNSVNADTGEKYHSNPKSYYSQIRAVSDRLCREHGLSVIMAGQPSQAVSYIEWLRQSKGQPTFRTMLEADLRAAIDSANDLGHFYLLMEHKGYEIHHGNRLGFRLRGQDRFMYPGRKNGLFTEEGIRAAIEGNLTAIEMGLRPAAVRRPAYRPYKKRPKYTGFMALYVHYLYVLGKVGQRRYPPRASPQLRQEVMKAERYRAQFAFLRENEISTSEDMTAFQSRTEDTLAGLTKQRTILNVRKKKRKKRLLSYGALKIHYDKGNGSKEVWEPVCRSGLRNLDDLEILNQYNAEIRGLYNYYRIAHNATVLNNFLYVMKYSMYKTFAGKYRTSMRKIIRKYTKDKDFVITYQGKSGEKSIVFYNQGMRRDTHVNATDPDIIGRARENRNYTSLIQRLQGCQCEWCGAIGVEIEIHHVKKLKDLSGRAEWERHMIARRRKTMALCHNCHVKLHAGKLD